MQGTTARVITRRASQIVVISIATLSVVLAMTWAVELSISLSRGAVPDALAGEDFRMFYSAASLGASDRWEDAYSLTGLAIATKTEVGRASFAYPPPFAQLLRPVTSLDYLPALVVWSILGAVVYLALVPLYLQQPGVIGLAAMAFPVFVALKLGQFAPLAVLILVGVSVAIKRDKLTIGGAILGLLILKPQFLLGPVMILLFDRSARRTLHGLVASSAAILGVSFAFESGAWRAFSTALSEVTDPGVSSAWDYSLLGVLGGFGTPVLVAFYGVIAAVIIGVAIMVSRKVVDPAERLAIALIVSVLISPRMVVYDWSILLVAAAWLVRRVAVRPALEIAGLAVAIGSLSGYLVRTIGTSVPIAWLTLLAFFFTLATPFIHERVSSQTGSDRFRNGTP